MRQPDAGQRRSPRASSAARGLARGASSSQSPSARQASICADRNRCLEKRCPARLRRSSNSQARAGSNRITASTPISPFLVPPKLSTSTPARQLSSAGVQPSAATALAKRAPSMCTGTPAARASAARAATSSGP